MEAIKLRLLEYLRTFERLDVIDQIHATSGLVLGDVNITLMDTSQDAVHGIINFKDVALNDNLVQFKIAISDLESEDSNLAPSLEFSNVPSSTY